MKSIFRLVAFLVLIVASYSLPATAQHVAGNCDSGCPTRVAGTSLAQIAVNATRGMGSPARPSVAALRTPGGGKTVTVAGSQSFTSSVPLFSIPGRNGLDVNLTLYYNSFIWTVVGNSIVLNADRDNPSPGFRLDFGYVEISDDGSSAMLVDPTGAKHLLSSTGASSGVTTDSTYIQAQIASTGNVIWVTYKNGLIVTYNVAPSNASLFRPAQFKDTNGNIFSIFYQDDSSTRLSQVIDPIGRKLNFAYDPANPNQVNSVTEVSAGGVALRTYTFGWTQNYPLYIAFTKDTGSLVNANGSNPSTINVLTSVTRPDGTHVSFGYADWGLVGRVSELSAPDANGNRAVRYSTSYNWPI